jgi:hypothetical protein
MNRLCPVAQYDCPGPSALGSRPRAESATFQCRVLFATLVALAEYCSPTGIHCKNEVTIKTETAGRVTAAVQLSLCSGSFDLNCR